MKAAVSGEWPDASDSDDMLGLALSARALMVNVVVIANFWIKKQNLWKTEEKQLCFWPGVRNCLD